MLKGRKVRKEGTKEGVITKTGKERRKWQVRRD